MQNLKFTFSIDTSKWSLFKLITYNVTDSLALLHLK